jgi:hypothetical protein
MLFVVTGFSTYSPNTRYRIKYKKKFVKFHVASGVVIALFRGQHYMVQPPSQSTWRIGPRLASWQSIKNGHPSAKIQGEPDTKMNWSTDRRQ